MHSIYYAYVKTVSWKNGRYVTTPLRRKWRAVAVERPPRSQDQVGGALSVAA
jgi:hypothetical protein